MQVYIFLYQACFQEKEEYENYLRIDPECLDELFVYTFPGQYYTVN